MRRHEEEENMKLPPGWEAVVVDGPTGSEGPTFEYHSSEGHVFKSLKEAVTHLFESNVVVPKRSRSASRLEGAPASVRDGAPGASAADVGRVRPGPLRCKRTRRSVAVSGSGSCFRHRGVDDGVGWLMVCGDAVRLGPERLVTTTEEVDNF